MSKEEISKMGIEELTKKLKSNKITTGILIGLFLVMVVASLMQSSEDTSMASKLLPIAFIPLVTSNIITIQKLKKELASRQVN